MNKIKNIGAISALTMLIGGCSFIFTGNESSVSISQQQVTKDITYLASDELKGRKTFSPEIDVAGEYIAQRFTQLGLEPMAGFDSFKQTFSMYSIKTKDAQITLNNQTIDASMLTVASSTDAVNWHNTDNVSVSVVAKDGDLRKAIRAANAKGGDHLFLVNSEQQEMFDRYKGYFDRGLTKSSITNSGTIVVVLSDVTEISALKVNITSEIIEQQLTNIVGVLPGKSKADEFVIYSGHYDHIGVNGEEIYNGANDNASGTTAVLNLAQYFTELGTNERSLMFIGFTGEELGLFGSNEFVKHIEPETIAAMINIEMIGKPSKFENGNLWMSGAERSNLQELLNANLTDELKIQTNPYPNFNIFYRSDNASLAKVGIPAHSFSTSQIDVDTDYHKSTDDLASLDLNNLHKAIEALAIATTDLTTGEVTPSRIEPLEQQQQGKIY